MPYRLHLLTAVCRALVAAVAVASLVCSGGAGASGDPDVVEAAEVIRAIVASGVHPDLGWSDFSAVRAGVHAFYERRGWRPAWFSPEVPTRQAAALAGLLREAGRKGLDAADYDGERWPDRLAGAAMGAGPSPSATARVDVALTVSIARYATDLRAGRVDPRRFRFDLPVDRVRPATEDLLDGLASADDVMAAVERLEPPFEPYRWTLRALQAALDAPPDAPRAAERSRHVRQLRLALERWRWIPHRFDTPPVVVNIPEYRLHVADPAHPLAMKVVVGRSTARTRTPVFAGEISAVTFRPFWNAPRRIQVEELLPKLEKSPSAFESEGYEVVDARGHAVAPGPEAVEGVRAGTLRIRQQPGPRNALGLVKLVMPNSFDVYLHGTPAMKLFERERRAASHGCIRVERPDLLAAWVLRGEPGPWTLERVAAAMGGDETFTVQLSRRIPVLIVYATATVDAAGEVHDWPDVYGHDAALERALEERRRTPPPSQGPLAHGAGVHVDEVRLAVIADAAEAQ